jgi:hypothetical protein
MKKKKLLFSGAFKFKNKQKKVFLLLVLVLALLIGFVIYKSFEMKWKNLKQISSFEFESAYSTKTFTLELPEECKVEKNKIKVKGVPQVKYWTETTIVCKTDDAEITIHPEQGGRGFESEKVEIIETDIMLGNYSFVRRQITFLDKGELDIFYELDLNNYDYLDGTNNYYLIEANFFPYSESARSYVEQILSTFTLTN